MSVPRYFSDRQLDILEQNPEFIERGDLCPVCLGDKEYFYKGTRYECPDDDYGHPMLRMAKMYWLSNIPLEYQYLLWEEFPHVDVKADIDTYVERFKRIRLTGMGFTFYGKTMGVGKTWAATHILRELVKEGYSGLFMAWLSFSRDAKSRDIAPVIDAEVLVLDDIKAAVSEAQRQFFEENIEMILRTRTNANFPTIVTSNLSPKEFEQEYPRCYSLLAGKNDEVELEGIDQRKHGDVFMNSAKLGFQGESRPIT